MHDLHDKITGQRGSALIVVLAASLIIAGAGYGFLLTVTTESHAQRQRTEHAKAIYTAEAGAADAVSNVIPNMDPDVTTATLGSEEEPIAFGGGAYRVSISAEEDDTYTVVSQAKYGQEDVTIVSRWGREYHPLRDYAIYSGNRTEAANDLVLSGSGSSRDIINGKVYVTGNLELAGQSEVHGKAVATGAITGNPVDGPAIEDAPKVDPPDLKAMKYDEIADFKIDAATTFDYRGRIPASDPRHIFVKEFRSDLAGDVGFEFDNTNYFFGDPWEGSNIDEVSVSAAGNNKVYFVDGNLWIEPQGQVSRLIKSPLNGTQITIVVRGNIYFADTLSYDDVDKDAILFIALTDGESFRDQNGNNQYDPGEPILHDDGDGLYQGPREGSGNIFFGDPNGGPLGHVHGYMYADNYFQDHVLDGPDGRPLPFEVTGFMSAGEQVQIKRDFGGDHAKMKVNFDSRVVDGKVTVPGFPEKESAGALGLLSWRLVTP
jgi:hypothetical protein